ncbi:hypothetical protein BGP77_00700 [Saccharospirillum sp. MSK14-1]|uniref:RDD family protein n=1 Tax=Saccharospirillum sp. MSK14-1 TaxID=1897632 RepID=UPI000D33BDA0|nr:RDD family protein [Saccharospirillum sp. MSK14-1]PTY35880.1 hypothetical protein BGP77_00700 [Saccharospirillum sp. MSK14-1]
MDELPFYVTHLSRRIIAKVVDVLLALAPSAILLWVLEPDQTAAYLSGGLWVFLILIADGLNGQSLGKRLVSIQVIARKSLKPCGPIRSIVRNSLLFPVPVVLDYLLIFLFDRRLGDLVAGTYVKHVPYFEPESD